MCVYKTKQKQSNKQQTNKNKTKTIKQTKTKFVSLFVFLVVCLLASLFARLLACLLDWLVYWLMDWLIDGWICTYARLSVIMYVCTYARTYVVLQYSPRPEKVSGAFSQAVLMWKNETLHVLRVLGFIVLHVLERTTTLPWSFGRFWEALFHIIWS